jgi:hypothetical protein
LYSKDHKSATTLLGFIMNTIQLRDLKARSGHYAYQIKKNRASYMVMHGENHIAYLTPVIEPDELLEPLRFTEKIREMKMDFLQQRGAAKNRGIAWYFTFTSWIEWWFYHKGPKWMEQRGTTKGKYVMARKGDEGPYAPWNVECIQVSQNHKDRATNGRVSRGVDHYCNKLTEKQVRIIFKSSEPHQALALKYGVNRTSIGQIKTRKMWKHVTATLGEPYIARRGPRSKSKR